MRCSGSRARIGPDRRFARRCVACGLGRGLLPCSGRGGSPAEAEARCGPVWPLRALGHHCAVDHWRCNHFRCRVTAKLGQVSKPDRLVRFRAAVTESELPARRKAAFLTGVQLRAACADRSTGDCGSPPTVKRRPHPRFPDPAVDAGPPLATFHGKHALGSLVVYPQSLMARSTFHVKHHHHVCHATFGSMGCRVCQRARRVGLGPPSRFRPAAGSVRNPPPAPPVMFQVKLRRR